MPHFLVSKALNGEYSEQRKLGIEWRATLMFTTFVHMKMSRTVLSTTTTAIARLVGHYDWS